MLLTAILATASLWSGAAFASAVGSKPARKQHSEQEDAF